MPNTPPPYPPKFKAEAVRRYRGSGKSLQEIASDLGVSINALREWVKRSEVEIGKRQGLTQREREALQRLLRDNRILQKREISRKTAAVKAQETTWSQ